MSKQTKIVQNNNKSMYNQCKNPKPDALYNNLNLPHRKTSLTELVTI